jgi:hypothetical protein
VGKVFGILGQSRDLSRVYLLSGEAIGGGEAGKPNLYLYERGIGLTYIATLSAADALTATNAKTQGLVATSPVNLEPFMHSARVSLDGSVLAFDSTARPTGYDNTDAASGEADEEVYRYEAKGGGLHCVSCLSSGARPQGADILPVTGNHEKFWVSAQIPGWETQTHASHVLSDTGRRLFFESYDSLVLADTNGAEDVYEWEAAGEGDCEAAGSTYVPSAGGCIALVSSGKDPSDSELVDASADGSDVFFKTAQSLRGEDPGLVDIYDARVDGGFPEPATPRAPCEGEACQSPPVPPIELTPASLTFSGLGNLSLPSPATTRSAKPKAKVSTQEQRLAKALKACRSKSRRKRAGCEAQARRRYEAKKSASKANRTAKKTRKGGK